MTNTPNTFDFAGEDFITNGFVVCTSTLTLTSTTTLTAVPGMTVNVNKGTYIIYGHIAGTADANGGLELVLAGTATVSAANVTCWNYNGTTINAVTNVTALGSSHPLTNQKAVYTDCEIEGVIVFSQPGSVILQATENTSDSTSTTVLVNSYLVLDRVS